MFKDTHAFSGFSVNDLEAAKKFYGDTLGLTVDVLDEGAMLRLAGGTSVFIYPKDNHTPASYTMLNFEVDDIDKAVDDLTARGIAMERYEGMPQDEKGIMRGLAAKQGPDIAWFTDPAGNIISVIKEE